MSVRESSYARAPHGASSATDLRTGPCDEFLTEVPLYAETVHASGPLIASSEEWFHLLLDAVTDYAIFMLDPEGRVMTWNVGAERSKGYTAEEILGLNFSIFFLPEDAAAGLPEQELEAAAREGRYAVDGWRQRKNGEAFWAQVTLTAIRARDGELRGFAKVTRDMSAQKASEDAIRRRNEQLESYRIIVENISEYVIFSLDPQGRITSWDAGAERESGFSRQQMLGQPFSIFFPANEVLAGVPEQELAEAARAGKYAVDAWRLTPGGRSLWSSSVLSAVRDAEGALTGYVRVARPMTLQKEAEDALRRLNAQLDRYRIIVENLSEYGISMLDPQGRYTDWGHGAAEQRTGYTLEDVLGLEYDVLATEEDRLTGLPRQELEEAARNGRSIRDAWKQRRDGTRFWATGVLTAVRDDAGNLTGYVRVGRDTTPQKNSEVALQALNAQLQRYRIIVENVDEYSIYTLDAEGFISSWEPGAQRLSGATAAEMVGRHYSTFFTPEEVAAGAPEHELAEAARNGRFASDSWRTTPKGLRVWSSGVLSALRDENGQLTGYMRIAHMLTAQKQAEETLRAVNAQLDRYRVIVESISDHVIFTLDAMGRFDSWSSGAQNVVGYAAGEVQGREYGLLFTGEACEAGEPQQELDQAARSGHCSTEGWRVRSNGEIFWCIGETTAIRDAAGALAGFVRVARDMTRQKRAEESLSRLATDLEQRVAERTGQLEATVSELRRKNEEVEALALLTTRDLEEKRLMLNEIHHRVKNNLQVVQSLLKMSVRSLPPGEARAVTMTTAQRVFAMAMVHEHLYQTKDLAGISISKYLRDLFAGVAESNAALHGQVQIEFDCDDLLLNLDHAIPFGLLVNELLSNCLKHGYPDGRKGTVTVSVHRVQDAVDLVFQDDGVGLPDGFDTALCSSMGLKLAASLCHQLGGKLTFTSGGGCRVETRLSRL